MTTLKKAEQAAMLYHEVKNACVKAKFLGNRTAFLSYLRLDDGRTVAQLKNEEFEEVLPEPYRSTVIALPVGDKKAGGDL